MKKLVAVSGIAAVALIGGLTAGQGSTPAAVSSARAVSASAPAATTAPARSAAEQQAVDSARSYLALGPGFSQAGLLKQLTSSYGAGLTQAQAEYAVSKVGL